MAKIFQQLLLQNKKRALLPLFFLLIIFFLFSGDFSRKTFANKSVQSAQATVASQPLLGTAQTDNSLMTSAGSVGSTNVIQQIANIYCTDTLKMHLGAIQKSVELWPEQRVRIWDKMTAKKGMAGIGKLLLGFFGIIGAGWLLESAANAKLNKIKNNIGNHECQEWQESLAFLFVRLICNLAGLVVFALSTMLLVSSIYEQGSPVFLILRSIIIVILTVRLASIIADTLLAHKASGIRLVNLDDGQAKKLYHWVIAFFVTYSLFTEGFKLLSSFGLDHAMFGLLRPILALVLSMILFFAVKTNKTIINQLFSEGVENAPPSRLRDILQQIWPTLVLLLLLFLWFLYSYHTVVGNTALVKNLAPVWWLLITFPIIDRMSWYLLNKIKQAKFLQSRTSEQRFGVFIRRILIGIRTIIVIAILVQLAKGCGFDLLSTVKTGLFERVILKSIQIALLLFFAALSWEVLQSIIERQLPEEQRDFTNLESEGGGEGATRSETLLPLLRFFFAAALIVTVVFFILDIIGVQVMPLLASAGVVGIAIGFGAQKLVQDVISGFFFLLDDAFRPGEYIEVANMRGTVEKISIRSMRLRHHRGAVQTVPYSEIATVSNLSRDWITMKLEIRLPYDTDPERVRKIIKKLGQRMLENEEYGSSFILPLKSQGVIRVEESALIFRVKFTSKPGEQWIIRRETYRLVKESLEKEGIFFAHRAIHILHDEQNDKEPEPQKQVPEEEVASVAPGSEPHLVAEAEKFGKIDDE